MVIDSPRPHIDGEAVLVASDVLRVRIVFSPYAEVSGVENAVHGKGPPSHFRGPSVNKAFPDMDVLTKYDQIEPIHLPQSVVTYLFTPCILSRVWVCRTYRRVLNWMIGFINSLYMQLGTTGKYSAIADLHTLQFTVTHTPGFSVFTGRILVTDLNTVVTPVSRQLQHT
jgi:hypothetical protein